MLSGAVKTVKTYKFRKEIKTVVKSLTTLTTDKDLKLAKQDKSTLTASLKTFTDITDFAPIWVIATISVSLGTGTMVGWKRIVVTIDEKIGNRTFKLCPGRNRRNCCCIYHWA